MQLRHDGPAEVILVPPDPSKEGEPHRQIQAGGQKERKDSPPEARKKEEEHEWQAESALFAKKRQRVEEQAEPDSLLLLKRRHGEQREEDRPEIEPAAEPENGLARERKDQEQKTQGESRRTGGSPLPADGEEKRAVRSVDREGEEVQPERSGGKPAQQPGERRERAQNLWIGRDREMGQQGGQRTPCPGYIKKIVREIAVTEMAGEDSARQDDEKEAVARPF